MQRAGGEHDLAGRVQRARGAALHENDAARDARFDDDAQHVGAGEDRQVRPRERRSQIGLCDRVASARVDVEQQRPGGFTARCIDGVVARDAGLGACREEGAVEHVGRRGAPRCQQGIVRAQGGGERRGVPARGAERLPAIEIRGGRPHVDHAVDRCGAADHPAGGERQRAAIEMRLRFRRVSPHAAARRRSFPMPSGMR